MNEHCISSFCYSCSWPVSAVTDQMCPRGGILLCHSPLPKEQLWVSSLHPDWTFSLTRCPCAGAKQLLLWRFSTCLHMVSLTSSWGPHKAHTNRLFHIFRHFQREWLLPQWSISTRFLSSPKKNFKRHSVLTFLFIDLKLKDIHFYEFHVFSECFIIVEGNRRGEGGWRSWASCLDSVTVISVNNSFKLQPQTTFFFLLLFFLQLLFV